MSGKNDSRRWPGILLSWASVLLAIVLCWSAVDIWLQGSALRSVDPTTVIYSVAAVRTKAILVCPFFVLWLIILVLSLCLCPHKRRPTQICARRAVAIPVSPSLRRLRWGLLVLAAGFVVLGVLNGGLRDVLMKAVNLCTECIGLG